MTEQKLARREFSTRVMNHIWDLSNNTYANLIKEQQARESSAHRRIPKSWFIWIRGLGKQEKRKR